MQGDVAVRTVHVDVKGVYRRRRFLSTYSQISTCASSVLFTRKQAPFLIIQDTKTFPKCNVGRNDKRNQQKLHIQVCGSLKTQRNQGCQG